MARAAASPRRWRRSRSHAPIQGISLGGVDTFHAPAIVGSLGGWHQPVRRVSAYTRQRQKFLGREHHDHQDRRDPVAYPSRLTRIGDPAE